MTTEEISKCYEENKKLIFKIAHSYKNCPYDFDEIVGKLNVGFTIALLKYDNNKGNDTNLCSYLCKCMRNSMNQRIRKDNSKGRTAEVLSYDSLTTNSNGDKIPGLYDRYIPDNNIVSVDDKIILRDLLDKSSTVIETILTDMERKIVNLYIQGFTQKEIGIKLSVSQAHVSKILNSARYNLKENLKEHI